MKDYAIFISYSDEDECYIAAIPDLKYCTGFGSTPVEVVQQLIMAKNGWLETAKAKNITIPEPNFAPMEIIKAFEVQKQELLNSRQRSQLFSESLARLTQDFHELQQALIQREVGFEPGHRGNLALA